MEDRNRKRPRVDLPPELGPFIEALAGLLADDHLNRTRSLKPRRGRAAPRAPKTARKARRTAR